MSTLKVDLDLVQKYNVAGPRYTSYPPATKFTDALTWDLSARSRQTIAKPRDLSVYFHIPFCETLCWFCGCTTVITLNHDKGRDYVDYLGREVALLAPHLHPERKTVQLHFGGGSPRSCGRRNPPPRRNHPRTFHLLPGYGGRRGSGPAPAHPRTSRRAPRNRLQPRLDGGAISIRQCSRPSTASSRGR